MNTGFLIALLLNVAAYLLLAQGIVAQARGRVFRGAILGLVLAVIAAGYHFVFANGVGWLADIAYTLRDAGLGMLVGGLWLLLKRASPRILLVPAVLLLLAFGTLFGLRMLFNFGQSLVSGGTTTELLVELGPDDSPAEITAILDQYGATYEKAFPDVTLDENEDLAQYLLVRAPAENIEALLTALRSDAENVDQAELNEQVTFIPELPGAELTTVDKHKAFANDPELAREWGLDLTNGHGAHALLKSLRPKRKAKVAIIDTGVDGAHEDISGVFGATSPDATDENGHGTHCAGVAGAATNNGLGIASLNWEGRFVEVLSFRALNADGAGTIESVAEAIIRAAESGVDVISLSLGGWHPTPPKAEADAIKYAQQLGVIVVAAAGNSDDDASQHSPANVPGVIVVAAVGREHAKAEFSNTTAGMARAVAAPGVDILSLKPGGGYVPLSGTSMATPYVAGLLGIARSLDPDLTAEAAFDLLHRTGHAGPDADRIGRTVDAEAVVRAVR